MPGTSIFALSGAGTSTDAKTKSLQPARNAKSAVTANAGRASGRAINRNDWIGPAPSIIPASSRSMGMVSKYPFKFQVQKISVPVV